MKPAVLFDLGNTLAAYYRVDQFRPLLEVAIGELTRELGSRGLSRVSIDAALTSAVAEDRESPDFRFTPMAERLERIFGISIVDGSQLAQELCALFLRPIFDVGRVYGDTLPVLDQLRSSGYPVGIVSNSPWGSPPGLWRGELARLGLTHAVDCVVLCGDVGWRKPAPEIFEVAAAALDRRLEECTFVGDDLRWDVAGSGAVGMRPVLMDRDRRHRDYAGERVEDLHALLELIEAGVQ